MKKWKGILILSLVAACIFPGTALAENLEIKGSTTVLPIALDVAEAFMKEYPQMNVAVSGGGSGNGIKAIIDGTTDIGDSSRFIKEKEVKMAASKGVFPVPFAVAYDCIIPVVHPGNSVRNLSLAQLKSIYQRNITNWNQVGGPDRPIVIVSRDTSSGTYEVWHGKVMTKENVHPAALLQASNGTVVQAVSKNPNAIGYIGLGYLNETVKALTVNQIQGSAKNTLNGTYPISRPLYMFTRGWPTGMTLEFINYVKNPKTGQKIVEKAGFIPLFERKEISPVPAEAPVSSRIASVSRTVSAPLPTPSPRRPTSPSRTTVSFSSAYEKTEIYWLQKNLSILGYSPALWTASWAP